MTAFNFQKLQRIDDLKEVVLGKYLTLFPYEDYASYSNKRAYYFERYLRLTRMKKRLLG